jgi:ABC-type uncharacterized transport system substrate-binding protein
MSAWPRFAAEFVRANVNVIVAQGTQAALAAKNATASLPIVLHAAGATPAEAGWLCMAIYDVLEG